ncbi:hypothetical protein [Nioella nitratireducens]|uniref:hypothetical protein n=1 Tax=Nioella nitratireducens TaxID=1287720 RepID=UPI0008FCF5F8|nr:hypothetical protein [Nioella nitratireducens]
METRRDGDDILTHFTNCPPLSFVRQVAETDDNPDTLETFRQSWCNYDWPDADLIAGGQGARSLSQGPDAFGR